jgi:hypothetical protein
MLFWWQLVFPQFQQGLRIKPLALKLGQAPVECNPAACVSKQEMSLLSHESAHVTF